MWGLDAFGGSLTPVHHSRGRPGSCCLPRISSSIFLRSHIVASSNCHVCRIVLLLFAYLHLLSFCYLCKSCIAIVRVSQALRGWMLVTLWFRQCSVNLRKILQRGDAAKGSVSASKKWAYNPVYSGSTETGDLRRRCAVYMPCQGRLRRSNAPRPISVDGRERILEDLKVPQRPDLRLGQLQ
jgi:hypothetical protein